MNDFGRLQDMPLTLTFADRHGHELEGRLVKIDDDDTSDAEYAPEDDSEDDSDTYSYDSDDSSEDDDFPDANVVAPLQDPGVPALGEAPDDDDDASVWSQSTQGGPSHPENPGVNPTTTTTTRSAQIQSQTITAGSHIHISMINLMKVQQWRRIKGHQMNRDQQIKT